jgi:4-hydroxy-tetrahydrodipicolinate synthase
MSAARAFHGVLVPVATPFGVDGRVDERLFVLHCRWLLAQGAQGLAIFGTTSEANSLSMTEKRSLLDALCRAGIDPALLMPGTGACALPDAVELTRAAIDAGCGGVLTLPPFYYKAVTEDGLFAFFSQLIESVASPRLRMYLYHIPPVAVVGIALSLIERLLKRYAGTVVGIKDSSGQLDNTLALNRIENFAVFAGSESFLLENMRAGGVGCITATGNVNVVAIGNLYEHWRTPQADTLQSDITRRRKIIEGYPVIPAVKSVLAEVHHDDCWRSTRAPLLPLNAAQRETLFASLRNDGFVPLVEAQATQA